VPNGRKSTELLQSQLLKIITTMVRPTLAEIRYYQVHGKQPDSLVNRRKKAEAQAKKAKEEAKKKSKTADDESEDIEETETEDVEDSEEETDESETEQVWPKKGANGWWELSSGKKIQNEVKARADQSKLDKA